MVGSRISRWRWVGERAVTSKRPFRVGLRWVGCLDGGGWASSELLLHLIPHKRRASKNRSKRFDPKNVSCRFSRNICSRGKVTRSHVLGKSVTLEESTLIKAQGDLKKKKNTFHTSPLIIIIDVMNPLVDSEGTAVMEH